MTFNIGEKMMKKYIVMMGLMGLVASCNQSEDLPQDENVIRIEAEIAGSRATRTSFEYGDCMGLYAVAYEGEVVAPLQIGGNYINNEEMTYSGQVWESNRTLYWNEAACDFYGIYPYQTITSIDKQLFQIATDQSSLETDDALGGYEASDLMWAKAEKKTQKDGVVKLPFRHMMSRLVVKLEKGPKFEGELPKDVVTHVYNTATTAQVNWQKGTLEKYGMSETKTIKMRQVDATTFDAIIVPQFIERSTPLVEITMEGIAYLLEYSMSFRPGYQHTITVTLNTSPDQEKIEIDIDGDISDWQ
jgi:hypothetical protein